MKTLICPTCGCSLVRLGISKDIPVSGPDVVGLDLWVTKRVGFAALDRLASWFDERIHPHLAFSD